VEETHGAAWAARKVSLVLVLVLVLALVLPAHFSYTFVEDRLDNLTMVLDEFVVVIDTRADPTDHSWFT
jgi:hypothetical protein